MKIYCEKNCMGCNVDISDCKFTKLDKEKDKRYCEIKENINNETNKASRNQNRI